MDNQYYNNTSDVDQMSPIVTEHNPGNTMSLRTYTFMLTLLIFLGFAAMGVCSMIAATQAFQLAVERHYIIYTVVCLVLSIGGVFVMGQGRSTESVGISLLGYAMTVLSMGFTTSLCLLYYDLGSISAAFLATAGVTVVMGCLGIAFPQFFAKIQGALFFSLFGVLLIEIPMAFLHIDASVLDYVVVVIFAGFIGRDFYTALNVAPTMTNAIYNACQLYLDILNVFMRLLSIIGNRRD